MNLFSWGLQLEQCLWQMVVFLCSLKEEQKKIIGTTGCLIAEPEKMMIIGVADLWTIRVTGLTVHRAHAWESTSFRQFVLNETNKQNNNKIKNNNNNNPIHRQQNRQLVVNIKNKNKLKQSTRTKANASQLGSVFIFFTLLHLFLYCKRKTIVIFIDGKTKQKMLLFELMSPGFSLLPPPHMPNCVFCCFGFLFSSFAPASSPATPLSFFVSSVHRQHSSVGSGSLRRGRRSRKGSDEVTSSSSSFSSSFRFSSHGHCRTVSSPRWRHQMTSQQVGGVDLLASYRFCFRKSLC